MSGLRDARRVRRQGSVAGAGSAFDQDAPGGHRSWPARRARAGVAVQFQLTHRELAVLTLLAEGRTAVGIAHSLGISPHTVSKHLQNVYRKLGTSDRLTSVLRAQALGLLPPPGDPA